MARDIDFILFIDGEDFTKYTLAWDITEDDDGVSSISAQIANPDLQFSGAILFDSDLKLIYGYEDMSFDTVYGRVRSITEDYALGAPTIKVRAECAVSDLHEASIMGHGEEGQGFTEVAKKAAEQLGVNLIFKDLKSPPVPPYFKIPIPPTSFHNFLSLLLPNLFSEKPTWVPYK